RAGTRQWACVTRSCGRGRHPPWSTPIPMSEGVELAATHPAHIARRVGMTGEVGVPEVAVVVHTDDLEAGRLEEPAQFRRIEEPVLRVVLHALSSRNK